MINDLKSALRAAVRAGLNEWRKLRLLRSGWNPDEVPF